MASSKKSKLRKLLGRYKWVITIWLIVSIIFIVGSLLLYYYEITEKSAFWSELADLLMTTGQAIIGAGLIGGGIGGVINFISEDYKQEQDELKERLKGFQERKEKRTEFRNKMQSILQEAHDKVELARVLIKSHKSGKTYGEQIRSRIMPSLISLKDVKRRLSHYQDRELKDSLDCLQVSLTYMIAYLSALMNEFSTNYLKISNLQNYQEALVVRMRTLFTEIAETSNLDTLSSKKKMKFLKKAEKLFREKDVPSNVTVVWKAMEELDYLSDFIDELRSDAGAKSMYNRYFLRHYYHCNRIIRTKESNVNEKIVGKKEFTNNIAEMKRITEIKEGNAPLTKNDSLTRIIMENELRFDFNTSRMKSDKKS